MERYLLTIVKDKSKNYNKKIDTIRDIVKGDFQLVGTESTMLPEVWLEYYKVFTEEFRINELCKIDLVRQIDKLERVFPS